MSGPHRHRGNSNAAAAHPPQAAARPKVNKPKREFASTCRLLVPPSMKLGAKTCCMLTMLNGTLSGTFRNVGDTPLVIGRREDVDFQVPDPGVSGRHAQVTRIGVHFVLEDLGSTNGSFVNGQRVKAPTPLGDGDRIQLGASTVLRVSLHDAAEQAANKRMYEAAVRDPLTGVFNRGHLDAHLVSEMAFALRHRTQLSVMFIDLDHFSKVNNTHGHQAGDAVLRHTAQAMLKTVRTEDVVARYGGEEFVVVIRGIAIENTVVLAERLRATVAARTVRTPAGLLNVTASVGVACHDPVLRPFGSVEELVAAADRAVYMAKDGGRNRVCVG